MISRLKGYSVQVYKDAEHRTDRFRKNDDFIRTDSNFWHSTSRTDRVARWYNITRPLTLRKAKNIARAYQREGCFVRIVERTNNGDHIVKVYPQRRNRK